MTIIVCGYHVCTRLRYGVVLRVSAPYGSHPPQ
jgi:hypothetical protein